MAEPASELDGAPSATPIQVGDLVAGKYRVHSVLGHGGMGRVFAATNEATGKSVALKYVLDPTSAGAAARFAREARAAGRIHHPNVVDIYDTVEHEGATCIVMEQLRGEPLSSRLARAPALTVEEAIAIAIEVARGIGAAHEAGVIHRDLKPGNLFLLDGERLRVKVLDFGISKILESDPQLVTNTGVVLGTPHYLSPEQVRGVPDIDERVDIYAMGAVLYEMLVGRPPHDRPHVPALLVDIATVVPVAPHLLRAEVPRALSDLVMRALSKDASARFQSADAFADALATLQSGPGEARSSSRDAVPRDALELLPTLEAPLSLPPSGSVERVRPRRAYALAGLALALLTALALVWGLWPERAPSPERPPRVEPGEAPVAEAPAERSAGPRPEQRPAEVAPTGAQSETVGRTAPEASVPSEQSEPRRRRPRAHDEGPSEGEAASGEAEASEVTGEEPTAVPPPTTTTTTTPPPRAGRLDLDDL